MLTKRRIHLGAVKPPVGLDGLAELLEMNGASRSSASEEASLVAERGGEFWRCWSTESEPSALCWVRR